VVGSDLGLTNTHINAIAVSGNYLFAGTDGNGFWRRPLSDMITAIKGGENSIPKKFSLLQNYPNPFNPSTVISYHLPAVSHVTLRIYDALGREVRRLVDEGQSSGSRFATFDAGNLPSGFYLCMLRAANSTVVIKMLLLK
jgi:hypothetical protein